MIEVNSFQLSDHKIGFQVIKYSGSCLWIWIGSTLAGQSSFSDLSLSVKGTDTSSLWVKNGNSFSSGLAQKLSKKLEKPVFVSYNLEDSDSEAGSLTFATVVKKLFQQIKETPNYF